jgi:hypothetical protein
LKTGLEQRTTLVGISAQPERITAAAGREQESGRSALKTRFTTKFIYTEVLATPEGVEPPTLRSEV